MSTIRSAFVAILFLSVIFCNRTFAVRFPNIYFFPFSPNFTFSLISEKGNTIAVTTKIVVPDDKDSDIFYLDWTIRMSIEKLDLLYQLRFMVQTNGDVYLLEMKDESYHRFMNPSALLFPGNLKLNREIPIGENMKLKYIKRLRSLKVRGRSFNNVLVAELTMGKKNYSLYFAEKNAIIGIKSDSETFRKN